MSLHFVTWTQVFIETCLLFINTTFINVTDLGLKIPMFIACMYKQLNICRLYWMVLHIHCTIIIVIHIHPYMYKINTQYFQIKLGT